MLSLNASLSIASEALAAQSGALGIVNNNIANASTPGYSRQVVNLSADALSAGGTTTDNGVSYGGFTSVRDELLQLGIYGKTSDAASLTTQSTGWSQIEPAFSSTTSGIGSSLSSMFSSLSALSTQPTSSALRQSALSAAGSVVAAFHQAANVLSTAQSDADAQVQSAVSEINGLTKQIASLDEQIGSLQQSGQNGGSLQDQRDQFTVKLAQLTGISSVRTESTPTLTTNAGSPLVLGNQSFALQVTRGADGTTHVLDAGGQDITAKLTGGALGGALTMRDSSVPQIASQLDTLATQFAQAMNSAQAQGYSSNGAAGQAMFSLPTAGSAAAGISLALTSGSSLALSSDGAAGSSGNLNTLLAVQTHTLPSGQTPSDTYASLVLNVGQSSANTSANLTATQASLQQLTNQQASTSGVSIDEEATNLIRFQQAYTAAAKVVSTLDQLYSAVINMVGP